MPDHIISVVPTVYTGYAGSQDLPALDLECSCGATVAEQLGTDTTLADLNDLADVHIEATERERQSIQTAQAVRRRYDTLRQRAQPTWGGTEWWPTPAPAEYVHGLDRPEQDPRRGVLGQT